MIQEEISKRQADDLAIAEENYKGMAIHSPPELRFFVEACSHFEFKVKIITMT